jgi:hypothetical protein
MEKVAWEARARIIWGAPVDEIADWLRQSGAGKKTARRIIRVCLRERARSVRRKGLGDILIGSALLIIGAALLEFFAALVKPWQFGFRRGRISFMIGGMGGTAAVFGVTFVVRGIFRLVLGARMRGAVNDMAEF